MTDASTGRPSHAPSSTYDPLTTQNVHDPNLQEEEEVYTREITKQAVILTSVGRRA